MAIHAMQGLMGAGKSCVAVNRFLADWLTNSHRPIYTNLPLRYVGEVGALVHEARPGCFTLALLWLLGLLNPRWRRGLLRRIAAVRLAGWKERRVQWLANAAARPQLLQIVANVTRNHARRWQMMERIHFLRPRVQQPLGDDGEPLRYVPLDEDGEPIAGAEPQLVGPKHGVREFWYFTKPNAVVFLDEVADIWNTDDRKNRPDTMKSYVRHHRHYKDDLYFFFQDKEDIDPDLRRKIQYLWTVRNSTKENMFPHWAFRGIKWPVQFFMVRCYLGRAVVGLAEDAMTRREPQEAWNFLPFRRDFATYHSFSQAGTLPGKKSASAQARSTDYDPTLLGKLQGFINNLAPLAAIAGGIVGLIGAWWWGIHWLMRQADGQSKFGAQVQHRTMTDQKDATPGTFVTDAGNGDFLVSATNLPPAAKTQDLERVVLVTPGLLRTTRKTYVLGDPMGDGVVRRFLINGVELEGGRRVPFHLLFPGQ
jgi:hypothetical protein